MQPFDYIKSIKTKTYLQVFGGITVVLTLFRFIAMDYWWIRVFDFPHVQLTVLSVAAFAAYFIKFDFKNWKDYLFAGVMLICMSYQIVKIYIYTPLASFEIKDAQQQDAAKQISFYTANVLQENEEYKHITKYIKEQDADILLFTETDKKWQTALRKTIKDDYPYRVEVPLPNTYGMLLYSRLELIDPKVKYQVEDSIPSIHTKLKLPSGDLIQLYSIHPTPPMPQHNPLSSERDKEMMLTALLAMNSNVPVIVIGDFNDVAWSQTTTLFQRVSGLLDPRKGRGLYNTFNAKNPIMRWPLDHVFVSPAFRVSEIALGEDINSDHFPVFIKFSLEPEGAKEQMPDQVTEKDLKHAKEQIKGAQNLDTEVY